MRRSVLRFSNVLLIAAGLLCMVPMLKAQNPDVEATYVHLYRNSNAETDLSKLALKHSSNDDVKKFAKQVLSENRALAGQIMTYAVKYNFRVISATPSSTKDAEKQMKSLTGVPFDKLYLVQMDAFVKDDLQAAAPASEASDPDVSAVGKQVTTIANARAKQIDELTRADGFVIR